MHFKSLDMSGSEILSTDWSDLNKQKPLSDQDQPINREYFTINIMYVK